MVQSGLVLWHLLLSLFWRPVAALCCVLGLDELATVATFAVLYHDETATRVWDGE